MADYFDAYKERIEQVNDLLIKLANELKSKGCTVYAPKKQLIKFIKVFYKDKHLIVGFDELPYSWYAQVCFKPSRECGSGMTIHRRTFDLLFSANEIMENLRPNPQVKDFKTPAYLEKL